MIVNPIGAETAPYIEQWVGIWAMREPEINALAEAVRGLNLSVHLAGPAPQAARDQAAAGPMTIADGVAIIGLRGRMQKQQSSMGDNASTVEARRAIRAAASDPNVGAILLVVD